MIPADADKTSAIQAVEQQIAELGLHLGETDYDKPWGAYFYIDPADIESFTSEYFPEFPADQMQRSGGRLQPKYLLIAPHTRFSWQYHERRGEMWRVVQGPVGVEQSPDDIEPQPVPMKAGEIVNSAATIRHRLCGLDTWGLVAEIWQHTDPARLSDESDIVRVADDFNR